MPGIGTMSSPRERTHASAIWEGLAPFSAASASTTDDELEIVLEVLLLEAWSAAPEVPLVELVDASESRRSGSRGRAGA